MRRDLAAVAGACLSNAAKKAVAEERRFQGLGSILLPEISLGLRRSEGEEARALLFLPLLGQHSSLETMGSWTPDREDSVAQRQSRQGWPEERAACRTRVAE